jgi:hypothetical protein
MRLPKARDYVRSLGLKRAVTAGFLCAVGISHSATLLFHPLLDAEENRGVQLILSPEAAVYDNLVWFDDHVFLVHLASGGSRSILLRDFFINFPGPRAYAVEFGHWALFGSYPIGLNDFEKNFCRNELFHLVDGEKVTSIEVFDYNRYPEVDGNRKLLGTRRIACDDLEK